MTHHQILKQLAILPEAALAPVGQLKVPHPHFAQGDNICGNIRIALFSGVVSIELMFNLCKNCSVLCPQRFTEMDYTSWLKSLLGSDIL